MDTIRSMEAALETQNLCKSFGDFTAVDGIDLTVPGGSFYGFLGPNGAGKSTTIKCLTGLLAPTEGTARILGIDPFADPVAVKRVVGVVPEDLALFDYLTARETLQFVGKIHGLTGDVIQERGEQLLEVMDLAGEHSSMAVDFSHGMRKKLALAAALLPAPRLLFLDEPFEGIDAVASRQLRRLLASFVDGGGTIFLTSHVLALVEQLCDHIGIIANGCLVAQGSMAELREEGAAGQTLEELFLGLVGATESDAPELDWLTG